MKNKKITVLFGVIAVIVFAFAIVTSVFAVKSGNEFKTANQTYMLYKESDSTFGGGTMSSKTETALKQAEDCKKSLTKYFAVSLLLYAAAVVLVLAIYMNLARSKQEAQETKTE